MDIESHDSVLCSQSFAIDIPGCSIHIADHELQETTDLSLLDDFSTAT